MEQHAEYSSVGYECIEPDISRNPATDAAESTAVAETTAETTCSRAATASNPDIVQRAVKITHALRMIRHKRA